jgi:hypothetical protein
MFSFSDFRGLKQDLQELTISPYYQQKGEFNPYYILKKNADAEVKEKFPDAKDIKYKCVESGTGELLKTLGKGKFNFQVEVDGQLTQYYVVSTASNVSAHYGMKTRKDSTASSNVNEFLTLYFMIHSGMDEDNAESWMMDIGSKSGDTGVLNGEGNPVTYDDLRTLLDKDETAIRDINIGYENALAVLGDINKYGRPVKYYWVPRGKPEGIGAKNPSDVIIKLHDGRFVGYSNKISAGKDATPKFNTNITAFYGKMGDDTQQKRIMDIIDSAWKEAEKQVPKDKMFAQTEMRKFDITKEKFSESSSRAKFAKLGKAFAKDKLDFFSKDFYYPFRNTLIENFGNYLTNTNNLVYFLNTVGYYTFDDPDATPCPYKLLIGSENGSTIKDVSDNEEYRQMLFNKDSALLKNVRFVYDGTQQSFKIQFTYTKLNMRVTVPITVRTRASGGWSGKSLYITSPGFIIK